MEIRNIDDCFKLRLLRKIIPDKEKSKKSIKISKDKLKSAKEAFKLKFFRYAIIDSYMAIFHAARALLYKDGIQEKNHFAVYIYLKEKYSNKIPLPVINYFNIHRKERHESMYGLEYEPSEDDAKTALNDAEEFLKEIGKLFNKN